MLILLIIVIIIALVVTAMMMMRPTPVPTGSAPTAAITVRPLHVCSTTETIYVTWDATGDRISLSATPPVTVVTGTWGVIPRPTVSGAAEVHLADSTSVGLIRITVESSRDGWPLGHDHRDVELITGTTAAIGGDAQCMRYQNEPPAFLVIEDITPAEWSEHIMVSSITVDPLSNRPFRVRHMVAGVLTEVLSLGATHATRPAGSEFPFVGLWLLSTEPLPPGEECPPPSNTDPIRLGINLGCFCA